MLNDRVLPTPASFVASVSLGGEKRNWRRRQGGGHKKILDMPQEEKIEALLACDGRKRI